MYESEKLAAIKNHLSCPLCHQIFTSPCFLSGCGHTFCGLCLRQRFSWRNECPQCKASARPSDLTSSLALNAIVSAYLRFDARAACLQQPTSRAASVPDDIQESSINYSLSSAVEVPGDSDHEGKCSEELKEIDTAERTSLTAVTADEMQRGEDSDEDESVWASAKLPAHRKDDNLQVFSELIHRKKRKTFSNGDIRVFAVDNRASASSSSSTKKPLHAAALTVTAIKCSEPSILETVLDENMDGIITTKEHCPERSYSSHKNTINLSHDATSYSSDSQIGEYPNSGSSLQITGDRKDHIMTDVQIHECAARACEREEIPLTNIENDSNSGIITGGARDRQDNKSKYFAQKSRSFKDIERGKDEKEDDSLFAHQNVADNQSSVNKRKVSATAEIINLEYSEGEIENVPEAIENCPPSDSAYNPVDLTGSTGTNRNDEDIDGNNSKYDDSAAMSDGKECSIEGSQVSLVISVTDDRNDTYESDNIDNNYNDNFHKNDEKEHFYIEKNGDGDRNSGSKSDIGLIYGIDRSEINDDGINFYDSDDDNNNESYDDNDTNSNTNNDSYNNDNQKYDYGDCNCNDDRINTNNNCDKNNQNNDKCNLMTNDKNSDETNDKNMCNNSDTDADNDNDSTQASNDSTHTAIRPDALHDNTASSYLSHTEPAILLGLKSNDKYNSSSSRRSDHNDDDNGSSSSSSSNSSSSDNNNGSSNYNNNSSCNSNNNDHNNNSSSSSYSSSSSSQIVDSHSHLINRHNPYTTTISNSTPSSSSFSSSRISSSSGPHTLDSTIIPDPGPRSTPIPGLHGITIKHNVSHTNYNDVKNKHNLDGRLDYLDGVLDSQVTVGTDDTSDECHTKNWTQNLECSANGEDSCADMVDKVRAQIVLLLCVYNCVLFCSFFPFFLIISLPFC